MDMDKDNVFWIGGIGFLICITGLIIMILIFVLPIQTQLNNYATILCQQQFGSGYMGYSDYYGVPHCTPKPVEILKTKFNGTDLDIIIDNEQKN